MKGATAGFDATPWARGQLLTDPERTAALAARAAELGATIRIGGRSERGPWVVDVSRLRFAGLALHDTIAFGLERFAAGASDAGIRWIAGSDGRAHGQPDRGRVTWTLCHRPALEERYRHPERTRCTDCWRALDRDVAAAARGRRVSPAPVFGQLAPCRRCGGRGEVRHEADQAAERERARLRRRGQVVAAPPLDGPVSGLCRQGLPAGRGSGSAVVTA